MTRKPLPKAIRRSLDDLSGLAARAAFDEEAPAPQSASSHHADDVTLAPAAFYKPVANDEFPQASSLSGPQAAKRRAIARKIVARHRTFAAVGGLCPLPVFNIAGVTAIIVRMVKQLSGLYGVPFERDRTRAAIIGLIGGAVPTGFGAATASTLGFIVPAGALVGLAVSALTAGALTRGIGLIFVEHFEGGTK
jgi:uncharacterized protein (DUF697 family)